MRRWMKLIAVPLALAAGHAAAQDRMDVQPSVRDIQFDSSLLENLEPMPIDERISHLQEAAGYLIDRGQAQAAKELQDWANQLRDQRRRELEEQIAELEALRKRIDQALGRLHVRREAVAQYVAVQAMIFDIDVAAVTDSEAGQQPDQPLAVLREMLTKGGGHRVVDTIRSDTQWLTSLKQSSREAKMTMLSRPQVMTLAGQQASIVVQQEIPQRITLAGGQEAVKTQWAGMRMNITPTLDPYGRFHLDCDLTIREPLDRAGNSAAADQAYQIREFQVEADAKLEEGSTLLIANPLPKRPAAKSELLGAPPEPCSGCGDSACGVCPAQRVYRVVVLTPRLMQPHGLIRKAVGRPLPAAHFPPRAVRH